MAMESRVITNRMYVFTRELQYNFLFKKLMARAIIAQALGFASPPQGAAEHTSEVAAAGCTYIVRCRILAGLSQRYLMVHNFACACCCCFSGDLPKRVAAVESPKGL